MTTPRSITTFFDECLECVGEPTMASAADLGMAFRAWIGDVELTDDAVVAQLVEARREQGLRVVTLGGSKWLIGAQISPIGRDMVIEGREMHLGAST
jgi:hypothetical protein